MLDNSSRVLCLLYQTIGKERLLVNIDIKIETAKLGYGLDIHSYE